MKPEQDLQITQSFPLQYHTSQITASSFKGLADQYQQPLFQVKCTSQNQNY